MKNLILFFSLFFLSFNLFIATSCKNTSPKEQSFNIATAIQGGNLSAVKKYIESGVDINKTYGDHKYTVLNIAIKTGQLAIVEYLVEQKADLELESNGKSPLMYAAKYDRLAIAKFLIAAGAHLTKKSYKGRTAIDYAKKYENPEVLAYLKSLE